MVQLANSEKLAIRYAPYIQELRDFFALHDVLCGAPRELGFFAARLSGRDSFPDEFASMVRSFIFREGGSFSPADLRTVVAVAVGGPSVSQSAFELQHPLHDLTNFLAAVAHTSLDQPRPAPPVAEENTRTTPYASESPYLTSTHTQEPSDADNPLRPHLASNAAISRAAFTSAPQQISASAFPRPARNRRRAVWAAFAVGLPLILLFAFLYHQPADTTPSAQNPASPPGPQVSSLSSPQGPAPTPLSNAVQALAHPASTEPAPPVTSFPSATGQLRSSTSNHSTASSPASPTSSGPSEPPSLPVNAAVAPSAGSGPTSAPANPAPPASQSTVAESSPAPRPAPPRASPSNPSVATVTAQQGAFGVSSGIMSSHLVSFSPPRYPTMAGFTHAQGQVILQAVVAKSGRVSAVKAITGPRTLRKAAEKAVRQWRYRPYVVDGHAADVATIITIDVKAPH